MCDESHHLTIFIVAEGFADQTVHVDLIPVSHIPHSELDEDVPVVGDMPEMDGM